MIKKNVPYALVLGLAVRSHWVLDLIVHLPELPLYRCSSVKAGFGLWKSPIATAIIEGLIFIAGLFP